ncbi:hypothetical protein K505DRAFT_398902 [Melanomma pulvis-pyrius CBS 109.77]|uniref:Uncharacterized protein n=1 Tax=Melanomma pulvis-pyrius CBS 109.77 TaxID=1314802 RepID=A0A6A6XMH7_9PLEO|nr:hypothetical protein K505DRAFT_398902 [Melanomma pulvis-pyrius CBS 109.77]
MKDGEGETPLYLALVSAVRYCAAGANPNILDKHGNTAHHLLAFRLNESEVTRTLFAQLIGRGLDINVRNARGKAPIFSLNATRPTRLRSQCYRKHERADDAGAFAVLEAAGADFFARDKKGRGLLHVAAEGSEVRFQMLLDKGLDPMLEYEGGQTALDFAAACGNKDLLGIFERKEE